MTTDSVSRYVHGNDCIQERFVDHEQLAALLADAYDYSEPTDFDYALAERVLQYFKTCSLRGQIEQWYQTGMTMREVSLQTGASPRTVREVLAAAGMLPKKD